MSLGNQIHELRKKNNLSQEQLAEKVGVARQTISKWELGETAPDIKQAQILSNVFNVSLDVLLDNDKKTSIDNTQDNKKNNSVIWVKIIALSFVAICICLLIVGILSIVNRSKILHPQETEKTSVITKKDPILLEESNAEVIVFKESGKPAIMCQLPEGFSPNENVIGLYTDEAGNYIKFDADYADHIINPLLGTIYYSYYEDLGYQSYIDMARMAMYIDLSKVGVFSSKQQIHLAGGARLVREQICAGQNADYYEVGSGLTSSGDEMRIYGFALHFENTAWLITLKDYEDNYYFITIKDQNGIGKSIDSVRDFLGSVYAGNAIQYSNILDTVAIQNARNTFMEYLIDHNANERIEKYFVFQADYTRFVAIDDSEVIGVYNCPEDALKAMLDDPDPNKLSETSFDNLWVYITNSQ